jgi:hypothetical protein
VFLLHAFNFVGGSVDEIFKNGTKSIWQIAIIVGVFSLFYPSIAYGRRKALIMGSYEQSRQGVLEVMETLGYKLEKEEGENLSFVKRSPFQRLLGMYEDRLCFTRSMTGFEIEGRVKDLARVISSLEARFRQE